jgi:hypothetical protein
MQSCDLELNPVKLAELVAGGMLKMRPWYELKSKIRAGCRFFQYIKLLLFRVES